MSAKSTDSSSGSSAISTSPDTSSVSSESFWDSDTISAYSNGAHSSSPFSDDPGDALLALQAKHYKRTINDLTRRVESSETEIARHLVQISMLEEHIEDMRRQSVSDKHEFQQQQNAVRWQEEQLRIKQEEISKMQRKHASVLSVSENKHRELIDELKAKLASADDEIRQLTQRIRDMARLLERSQMEEQECQRRCVYLDKQLSDARMIAAEATRLSTDLTEQLSERAAYTGDLEQRITSLISCFSSASASSVSAMRDPNKSDSITFCRNGHGSSRSGIMTSLHAEIAQATQFTGQLNMHPSFQPRPSDAEPLLDDICNNYNHSGILNNDHNDCEASCVFSTAANPFLLPKCAARSASQSSSISNRRRSSDAAAFAAGHQTLLTGAGSEGHLYWLAVYAHMIWSFYLRLWVWPVWRCICLILGIFMDILACRPIVRALLGMLLFPYKTVCQAVDRKERQA
ncbi:hypothetical protein FB639_000092 [Coemansia asiatica]|nr:hypothetical protein FB639_000092 [Coemansia asiatica]